MTCTVCLGSKVFPVFQLKGYHLSRCGDCGHLFVSDDVTDAMLEEAYGKGYYAAGNAENPSGYQDYLGKSDIRIKGFNERLQQVERYAPHRGHLLDYGCAVGLFVKVAADAGWKACGYERSEWAANYARSTLGLDVVTGNGQQPPFASDTFDVVTMWDVVEHLVSPREILGLASEWLRPGGLIALNTVNSSSLGARLAGKNWRHIAPPLHLQYFTRASLVRLLQECGFKIVSMTNNGVMLRSDKTSHALTGPAALLENLVTHWRARPISTALNLLDEVDIIAVKL